MPHRAPLRAAIVLAGAAFATASLVGCGNAVQPATPSTSTSAKPTTTAPSTLSAPKTKQPHIMDFTASGTATITSISYTVDGQTAKLAATPLPWHQSLNIPADGAKHNYEVDLYYRDGNVALNADVDGQNVGATNGSTSGGSGDAQLSGDFLG